jgi:hypothetical protein
MNDFFISYTGADKAWAEGLARWLDEAGFSYTLQAADFVAGSNFILQRHWALTYRNKTIKQPTMSCGPAGAEAL